MLERSGDGDDALDLTVNLAVDLATPIARCIRDAREIARGMLLGGGDGEAGGLQPFHEPLHALADAASAGDVKRRGLADVRAPSRQPERHCIAIATPRGEV